MMTDCASTENIIRRRMHGLYLSRQCADLETLAHELLGLHSWFYRNVPFSALIRGADIRGWESALTKTWLYRGTLHGVKYEDLPMFLALNAGESKDGYFSWLAGAHGADKISGIADEVMRLMEDQVCSRREFRTIFAGRYDPRLIDDIFSPWGGIFVHLARLGKVAFKDMTSRDFTLIGAEPSQSFDEVLPELLRRYFAAYGPATFADAAWFFGLNKDDAKKLPELPLDDLCRFESGGKTYYCGDDNADIGDIPKLMLLSGFDPLIASYIPDDRLGLPQEYKTRVILKSGICLPSVAVNGRVAGIWNIKKNEPAVEFFTFQPKRVKDDALERVESIIRRIKSAL
ncbi:MAG: winged helix DNA-binding domain-containing protein, partial [Oscillospiraceae bacterium]|nr:winged helix DNA-binding domain-containing protein [Oscillospiraceae bacterium]